MQKIFLIVFFFVYQVSLSQEYQFDYSSTYNYRLKENDSSRTKIIILANSSTEDYLLRIYITDDKIWYCSIIDFVKNKQYEVENFNLNLEKNINLIIKSEKNLDVKDCDNMTNKYSIDYITVNNVNVIKIKRYKNKKKIKLINESIFFTKPYKNIKNQQFSFPPLIFPLRCNKFKLDTDEVITEVNFKENNKEIYFYKLIELKVIDFKIKI